MNTENPESSSQNEEKNTQNLLFHITCFVVITLAICVFFVALSNPGTSWLTALGLMILAALGCSVTGGFFGFLFGMPREFAATDNQTNGDKKENDSSGVSTRKVGQWANNNLLEVSDWLTKIVVGLTLVNLSKLLTLIGEWGQALGASSGLPPGADVVAGVSIILCTFAYGFVGSYVLTRTRLSHLLATNFLLINASLQDEVVELREGQEKLLADNTAMISMSMDLLKANLYRPKPHGFNDAIEIGKRLLDNERFSKRAKGKLYGYLACAYGQKFGYQESEESSDEELQKTADDAYEAVKKAVELRPDRKTWLRKYYDVTDPSFRDSDSDLAPFFQSEIQRDRFDKLLS